MHIDTNPTAVETFSLKICKFRPAHGQYDYCSKTCARAAPKSPGLRPTPSTPQTQKRRGLLYAQNTGTGYGYDDGDGGNGDGNEDDEDNDEIIRPRKRALSDFAVVRRGPQLCLVRLNAPLDFLSGLISIARPNGRIELPDISEDDPL